MSLTLDIVHTLKFLRTQHFRAASKTHLKQIKMKDSVQNKNRVFHNLSYVTALGKADT